MRAPARAGWLPRILLIAATVATAWSTTAHAHQASFTYGRVELSAERTRVDYVLEIDVRDLNEALALDRDRAPTDTEILARRDRLFDYVTERVALEADHQSCRVERGEPGFVQRSERFVRLPLRLLCARPIAELAIDYDLFFDLDPLHTSLLTVGGDVVELNEDRSRFVYVVGEPPPSGWLGWIRSGIDHILFGLDHILFLVSLLVMAAIARGPDGWLVRGARDQLRYTGILVTSFTLAHSLTLIGAALGWLELPSRAVETAIALSIVFVAVDNVVRPDPPHRYAVTFGFGLIHGLGFASMLRPLLPPDGIVQPLLLFNVGVELGQLGIVAAALPALSAAARALGPDRYRRFVLPAAGAVLAALGSIWAIERAFDLTLLGL